MNRATRLQALEEATGARDVQLQMPQHGDDHDAEWRRLLALGGEIRVVHYPGLNDEAVAAFHAARPDQ